MPELLHVLFYNQPYLANVFQPGKKVLFYGKAEKNGGHAQMVHPEYDLCEDGSVQDAVHAGRWTPVYPLTEDLSQKTIRQLLYRVLHDNLFLLEETLPAVLRNRQALAALRDSVRGIHFPSDLEELRRSYRRLVFDEFLVLELAIEMKKAKLQKENYSLSHLSGQAEIERWSNALDFELTPAQKNAMTDIMNDMKSGRTMHRLLQGDVGSGKTVVAAAALYFTALNGFQGALMAPTEVLAQQLYFQMTRFLTPFGIRAAYLAQSVEGPEIEKILQELADGQIQVAVGTHALIGENVRFRNLGLAVVDEQHKFGVFQRSALKMKGLDSASGVPTHFLLMTATPIPRTLAMTVFGDMEVSVIHEQPKGRLPVRTLWVEEMRRESVYHWLDGFVAEGAQAFVICPLVDKSQAVRPDTRKSAEEMFERIRATFPNRTVGLLHGSLKAAEKQKIMHAFKEGRTQILVSTVVVEVGVDVPNARCLIIENADRFGLAQLHQLRGRVGRGSGESYCILFSESTNTETVERLSAFEKMHSGFDIAEKDLEQRGAGEYLGAKQHGLPAFRIGDLVKDRNIFLSARYEAKKIIAKDECMEKAEHRALKRTLKERFGQAGKIAGTG